MEDDAKRGGLDDVVVSRAEAKDMTEYETAAPSFDANPTTISNV